MPPDNVTSDIDDRDTDCSPSDDELIQHKESNLDPQSNLAIALCRWEISPALSFKKHTTWKESNMNWTVPAES